MKNKHKVFTLNTLKYESEAISLVVNGSCFWSKTLQMVGYESGKKEVSRNISVETTLNYTDNALVILTF